MSSVSLCMIAKDAAGHLAACLQSARPYVNEIVVADTGSKDETISIARQFGARVFTIPWTGHFAEARNHALERATCDWILSLDADEMLDPATAGFIAQHIADPRAIGYQVTIRNYVVSLNERIWDTAPKNNDGLLAEATRFPGFVEHENVRLFRRDERIRFTGRVHESTGPSIRTMNGKLGQARFLIHHFGLALTAEEKARKNRLYREMGEKKLQENPNDWQAWFELGLLELQEFSNLTAAQHLFDRAIALNPQEGMLRFFLGLTVFRMGCFEEAISLLEHAEQLGHRSATLAETIGDAQYNIGDYSAASCSFNCAIRREAANSSARAKYGLALVRCGQTKKGLNWLRDLLRDSPATPEYHEALILSLVFLNRIADAARASSLKLERVPSPLAGDYLRTASLWAQAPDFSKAEEILRKGRLLFPEDSGLQRAYREICAAAASTPESVS